MGKKNENTETVTEGLGAPEGFDLEAWMAGAKRPEKSVTLYARADVIGELDELERQIQMRIDADEIDPSLAGDPERAALEARYEELLGVFHDSARTFRMRALTGEEIREARKQHGEDVTALGAHLLALSSVSPKLTVEDVTRLEETLGSAQMNRLVTAYQEASSEAPKVNAPFWLKSSGRANGDG